MSFEHLIFKRHWDLSEKTIYRLGQCDALLSTLAMVPLGERVKRDLKFVSLRKGAQASTAIEGNTLSEKEIEKIVEGEHLAESKAYQEQEVKNILVAMTQISKDILTQKTPGIITPDLLREYHHMVGKDLPTPFNAVPGQFAQSQRVVGGYRCPPHGREKHQVEGLVKQLCDWLPKEFKFVSHEQAFKNDFLKAIVTHVYIELIHPFDDGNGRTGRLVEFYLLLRAGVPDICPHILSNHYNETRPEYYAHLNQCQKKGNLTSFIDYAVTGFFDGLKDVWNNTIAHELLKKVWHGHIQNTLAEQKWSKNVTERRRRLLLGMPHSKPHNTATLGIISFVANKGAVTSTSTRLRDIKSLVDVELLVIDPETKHYFANTKSLYYQYPKRRQ